MEKENVKFKISLNWGCVKSLEELISDAKFIFQNDGYKGRRPRIVLNTPINEYDVIELDYDSLGLIANATAKFNEQWGKSITDSSKDIRGFIEGFLCEENCTNFVIDKSLDEAVDRTIEVLKSNFVSPSEDKTAEPEWTGRVKLNQVTEGNVKISESTPVIEQKEDKIWKEFDKPNNSRIIKKKDLNDLLSRIAGSMALERAERFDLQKEIVDVLESKQLTPKLCNTCGSAMVFIRSKYPHGDKREICPTCAYERLEQIQDISNHERRKTNDSVAGAD